MADPHEALRRTFAWRSVRRSLTVAAIVGTILNSINQGDALLAGQPLVIWKLLLTFAVRNAMTDDASSPSIQASNPRFCHCR